MNQNNLQLKYLISIILGYYLGQYLSKQCPNEFCLVDSD